MLEWEGIWHPEVEKGTWMARLKGLKHWGGIWCGQGGQQHQATQGFAVQGFGERAGGVWIISGVMGEKYGVMCPWCSGETRVHFRHCLAPRYCNSGTASPPHRSMQCFFSFSLHRTTRTVPWRVPGGFPGLLLLSCCVWAVEHLLFPLPHLSAPHWPLCLALH